MAIMNSKGDSASPWKSPLWIFCYQLHSPGLHGLFDEVYNFMWFFAYFETVLYPVLWNHIICLIIIIIIIIIIIYSLETFTSAFADGFSLEFEWQQVSRTLLTILVVLNNVVVWMVSTRPPTSKSFSPFSNPFVTVPNTPITIGIIVTCMFRIFFNSLARSKYLSFFSNYFSSILWSAGTAKSTILQVLFFFFVDYY